MPAEEQNSLIHKMNILVTGASGFIGSFLVEKALDLEMNVWAGVRGSSSRRYLQDERINFIELDFDDEAVLTRLFAKAKEEFGAWDVVIHAAGITKSRFRHDFFAVNYNGTRNLVNALRNAGAMPRQFVYLSSLSIYGALREEPIGITPQPNTAYGMSKAAAENFIRVSDGLQWVIFRPTGVYGPRERDYFLMAKSIKSHVDFAVGFKRQEITFVYVKDLVDAVFAAIERGVTKKTYLISDGRTYNSRTFGQLLQNAMSIKGVVRLTVPLWILRAVCAVAQTASKFTGKTPTLNLDKYRIMKQRNWQCDISDAVKELDYRPKYDLKKGVDETVAWYNKEQWI